MRVNINLGFIMSFGSIMILYILLDLFANTQATCTDVEGWLDSTGKLIQLIELLFSSGLFLCLRVSVSHCPVGGRRLVPSDCIVKYDFHF